MDESILTNDDTYDTLPDDAWKDSFDKLLDQKPILREMNVIKKDIRASFNMNSSYENSCYDNSGQHLQANDLQTSRNHLSPFAHIQVPDRISSSRPKNTCYKSKSISTPLKSLQVENPFECALSPVGDWTFKHFKNKTSQQDRLKSLAAKKFSATPIRRTESAVNVESFSGAEMQKSKIDNKSITSLILEDMKKKRSGKHVRLNVNFDLEPIEINDESKIVELSRRLVLQPGKWRKSLNLLRRTQSTPADNPPETNDDNDRKRRKKSTLAGQRKSILIGKRSTIVGKYNFKRQLLQRCLQNNIVAFADAYNEEYLKNCCKIGEGAFGEVFLYTNPSRNRRDKTVLKIIPIEGKDLINGEIQKTYEQILQEVVISMELSALKRNEHNLSYTSGFVNIEKISCVKGQYPALLTKHWEEYDEKKESENDHPGCFPSIQQYVVLEMTFCGEDMEKFVFRNAEQSYYALRQIICTLAVGEHVHQFEHRDLHWGNVLVLPTHKKYIDYKLKDNVLNLPTKGIQIAIIDYTLSRITYDDYCYYNDLSSDTDLFTATGDYQFDMYRMMRELLCDKWDTFQPKTNIYWISYIISKMLNGVTYKNIGSKLHMSYIEKLKELDATIMNYDSCIDCIEALFLSNNC